MVGVNNFFCTQLLHFSRDFNQTLTEASVIKCTGACFGCFAFWTFLAELWPFVSFISWIPGCIALRHFLLLLYHALFLQLKYLTWCLLANSCWFALPPFLMQVFFYLNFFRPYIGNHFYFLLYFQLKLSNYCMDSF